MDEAEPKIIRVVRFWKVPLCFSTKMDFVEKDIRAYIERRNCQEEDN